jgi:tetratricopeptide (TPR) repeat protein
MLNSFLKILPSIASHPVAIVAWICLAVVWLLWQFDRHKAKIFLDGLAKIAPGQREAFCRSSGYKFNDLASVPERERLKLLTRRYFLIAFVLTVLALLVLVLVALHIYQQEQTGARRTVEAVEKIHAETDAGILRTVEAAVAGIEKSRAELQQKLDQEQQRSAILARVLQGTSESMNTAARYSLDPEVKLQAEKLTQLLDDFDVRFGPQHSAWVALSLRLARATVANAEGCYAQALELIPEAETDALLAGAREHAKQAEDALRVRGDAFFNSLNWSLALTNYSRMLGLNADNVKALVGVGASLLLLGLPSAALTNFEHAVRIADRGIVSSDDLAVSLSCRGAVYIIDTRFSEARQDFKRAAEIYERLVKEGRNDLLPNLVGALCTLSGVDIVQDHYAEASANADRAAEICDGLIKKGQPNQGNILLVAVLLNRANANLLQGHYPEASRNCDRAVKICGSFIVAGRTNPASSLLPALLLTQAQAYRLQGKQPPISQFASPLVPQSPMPPLGGAFPLDKSP